MRIAVAATAPFGARVLGELAETYDIEALITRPDRPRGRGRRLQAPPAKETAELRGIAVLQPDKLTHVELEADVVVVAAYGVLIPEGLLQQRLWLNVHPSLLPRWRGAAPVERTLMAGDEVTGVTIHRTTAELDAGPIAAQETFAIEADDDAGSLFERSAIGAGRLLREVLGSMADGPPEFVEQAAEGVTYAEKIAAADRELDWARPVEELVNHVRALSPHIGAWGVVDGRRLIIWRARAATEPAALRVGDVELLDVQPEGGRRMGAEEYVRGRQGGR